MLPILLLIACQPQLRPTASGQALGFGLAFSGNVDGEIEPCG
jgi:hypothetical protein